ncbi:MAG: hydrogen gas-evolving membrane-bound hydrogenase subunit E [Candidatus Nanosalina sp.]
MVDSFSVFMALLASGVGVLVFTYSSSYMAHETWKRKYYTVLTAFMGSMIGLVYSSNLVLLFMFWEFTSVCSFLLISHSQRTESGIVSSRKSMFLTVGSGMLLLSGFLILREVTGTLSLAEMLPHGFSGYPASGGLLFAATLLIGVGAMAKSAQVPLHIWLPDAMEAPTPVSAFLHSATMVKAGVFLVGRLRPLFAGYDFWSLFFMLTGLSTMTAAAHLAFCSEELKQLLAYSTASHLGLIMAGFGFPSVLGAETGVFHILNHAVFKASLFMVAGIVLHETGTQKFSELSGLGVRWKGLAAIATVSALGMAGIPLFNGFFSKELLFESAFHFASERGGITWFVPVVSVLGSIFTFLYSVKFVSIFYGDLNMELPDIPWSMFIPPGILASIVLIVGIMPGTVNMVISEVIGAVTVGHHVRGFSVSLPTHLKPSVVMSIVTIFSGLLIYRKRDLIEKRRYLLDREALSANHAYQELLESSDCLSDRIVGFIETSLLRTYATWFLLTSSILGVTGFVLTGFPEIFNFSATLPMILVLATAIGGVYAVLRAESYLSSVLTLSILGFMVSIFYLLMDAPDLVMTQLVVESLSLVIFLIVLNRLPGYVKQINESRKYRDVVIAGFTGFAVSAAVSYADYYRKHSEISRYYIENALPGSGGGNIVNVILVDFRGLDTMVEISVIAMAGLAILMLFKMRGGDE